MTRFGPGTLAIIIVLTLVLSPAPGAPPVSVVEASSPVLTAWNGDEASPLFVTASSSIWVRAGGDLVESVDGDDDYAPWGPGLLVLDLTGVEFAGVEFNIYVSENGYSSIDGDKLLAGRLRVTLLDDELRYVEVESEVMPGNKIVVGVGRVGGRSIVHIKAPFYTPGGDKYVKVFDGSRVLVTIANLRVLPAVRINPTEGPVGNRILVEGSAWPPNSSVTLHLIHNGVVLETWFVESNPEGYFSTRAIAPDAGKIEGETRPDEEFFVFIQAYNGTDKEKASAEKLLHSARFILRGRYFIHLSSYKPDGDLLEDTGAPGKIGSGVINLDGMVGGLIKINGSNFNVRGGIEVYWDYDKPSRFKVGLESLFFNRSSGYVELSFRVPESGVGEHLVAVVDGSWSWNFTMRVVQSLVVEPGEATPDSEVLVKGYGFSPGSLVNVTFYGLVLDGLGESSVLAENVRVDSSGSFTVEAKLPDEVYGGDHYVVVGNETQPSIAIYKLVINPRVELSKLRVREGELIRVRVVGWPVGVENIIIPFVGVKPHGSQAAKMTIAWDGVPTSVQNQTILDSRGTAEFDVIAVGRPGLHYLTVHDDEGRVLASLIVEIIGEEELDLEDRLRELESRVRELELVARDLGDAISRLRSLLNDLRSRQSEVFRLVDDVSSRLGLMESRLPVLEERTQNLTSAIAELRESLTTLPVVDPARLEAVASRVESLEATLDTLSGDVTSLVESLDENKERVELTYNIGLASLAVSVAALAVLIVLVIRVFRS